MAESTQYSFELREVAELLVKQQGLHEGRWMIGFEFALGAGNMGATPADVKPSALAQIKNVLLLKAGAEVPEAFTFVVDAAKINPVTEKRPRTEGR